MVVSYVVEQSVSKTVMWRQKNEVWSISFLEVFFSTFSLISLIFMTSHSWFFRHFVPLRWLYINLSAFNSIHKIHKKNSKENPHLNKILLITNTSMNLLDPRFQFTLGRFNWNIIWKLVAFTGFFQGGCAKRQENFNTPLVDPC